MKLFSTLRNVLRKRTRTPAPALPLTASTIDLGSPAIARDPFPHYETLRAAGPVQFLARHDAWIVLGHDEVQSAFARPDVFSNTPYHDVDAVLLGADPPQHAPMRRIASRLLSPDVVERLSAFAESHAQSLLQPRMDLEPPMDLVNDYAGALSKAVAAQLVGFDTAAVKAIDAARAAAPDLAQYVHVLDRIAEGSAMHPRLVADGLSDAAARSVVRLFWLAATTTTERAIAHCALRLLQHDDVRRALEADRTLVPAFVEEVLRLHPPELMVPRLTTEPVTLGGALLPAGAVVHLCVAAANRDPAKFATASELQLDRPPQRHFSFGFGIHHCVGAALGRRTIETSVRTLLQHAPAFRATMPLDDVVTWCSLTASPVGQLPVELRR